MQKFRLSESFLDEYKNRKPNWGPLGEFIFLRTYSRFIESENRNEKWWETIRRVVEGTFNIQKDHCASLRLPWYNQKAQKSAKIMYDKMFNFKFTPSGRGLWLMGTEFVEKRGAAALCSCAFVSTKDIETRGSFAFCWSMDALMLGLGVGFDTKGAGKITIRSPREGNDLIFVVPDSREGWIEGLELVINAYFTGSKIPNFDFSKIRPYGTPIKGFGGVASGPKPLKELYADIQKLLNKRIGEQLLSTDIVDIMNLIARTVIAGNVRRSAEIAFGDPEDKDYVTMKDPKKNLKKIQEWRWASNNSVFAEVGKTDYVKIAESIIKNGEPGVIWLNNAKKYGRINDGITWIDKHVGATNPCQPGWAKILTPNGISKLESIKIGDKIWSEEGWTTVINKVSSGIKKVYKYSTTAGVFYGTENHKILQNKEKIEVKDAVSIDILTGEYKINYSIDPQDVMDGLVIGNGGVHKASNNLVCLYIGENDGDYFDSEIKDLILKHRPRIRKDVYEIKTTITANELLRTFDRKIPGRFMYSPNKVIGFLRGIYSANGSIINNRITLKQSSKKIIEDVQTMLSSIGIRSYYTTNKERKTKFSNGEYLCKKNYDLNITVDREKFINIIGFIQKYKNEKIEIKKSNALKNSYDIKSIEFVSEEEVFDITVDNNNHTYWSQCCNVSNCGEIFLESCELCNLVETFPSNHSSYEEYQETLKYAYLYGKTITLMSTHWPETNQVIMKNRRIGVSQTGIIDAFVKHGRREMMNWCENGYKYLRELDEIYSNWLCTPKSIKITTTKPSGSVSLLSGVSPGIHYPHSKYYIRRVRIASDSNLIESLQKAGYHIEQVKNGSKETQKRTFVISFPIEEKNFIKNKNNVSIWEQVKNAVDYQRYWADNSVSITVTFKKEEEKDIPRVLEAYEDQLKAITFLPILDHQYEQVPYEEITEEEYNKMIKKIKEVDFEFITTIPEGEKFCSSETCQII